MKATVRSFLRLPRQHRGSFATVALVSVMFVLALLWVRGEQLQDKPAPRPVSGAQG